MKEIMEKEESQNCKYDKKLDNDNDPDFSAPG
jgi:hypothetical protein